MDGGLSMLDLVRSSGIYRWGFVALLFALVNLVLWPLQKRFFNNQKRLREMRPELEALRTTCASNPSRLASKTKELYEERGASPGRGIAFMAAQLPLWFIFYTILGAIFHGP
jgi:membrane protein insertase Oxa1/YidC/SpoIIIJ